MAEKEQKPKMLNGLLSIEKNIKGKREGEITEAYQNLKKSELQYGHARVYQSNDENGVKLPPENKRIQIQPEVVIRSLKKPMAELMDLVATRDATNCVAKADIVVDGEVFLKDVPAITCLFLERKLSDLATVLKSTEPLTVDEAWTRDEIRKLWVTEPTDSAKTKKVTEFVVPVAATAEHPAQIKEVTKDIVEGIWKTTKMSSAMTKEQIAGYVEKIEVLQKAVKTARQEANSTRLVDLQVGDKTMSYIFG